MCYVFGFIIRNGKERVKLCLAFHCMNALLNFIQISRCKQTTFISERASECLCIDIWFQRNTWKKPRKKHDQKNNKYNQWKWLKLNTHENGEKNECLMIPQWMYLKVLPRSEWTTVVWWWHTFWHYFPCFIWFTLFNLFLSPRSVKTNVERFSVDDRFHLHCSCDAKSQQTSAHKRTSNER